MKYASFGTISHGTLRTEDLIEAFTRELEHQVQCNAAAWCSEDGRTERDRLLAIVAEGDKFYSEDGTFVDEDDEASEYLNETLFDALQTFAPPYAYFGAHVGDGSDFGYWLSEDAFEDFDGLRVSDTSEVPDGYSGEVLHINDHGNTTLYAADRGVLREVWGIV
jgi:hypothetical protein